MVEVEEVVTEQKENTKQVPVENGGSTDKYIWTQTAYDVSCIVDICKLANISSFAIKNIKVDLTNDDLKIFHLNKLLVEGKFQHPVKVETSTWYKEETKIILELDKYKIQEWWSCFFLGDIEIDSSKIVPATEYVGDLDQETRMTIDKMMYEQKMKEAAGFYDRK